MNRRKLLKKTLLLSTAGLIGGTGMWFMNGTELEQLTIEQAIKDLHQLEAQTKVNQNAWNLCQLFNHLAQSVEYSMTGYPAHESDVFKATIGQAAFKIFSTRGKMSHELNEPIPGAPLLQANDQTLALNRLLSALNDFKQFQAKPQPHFAYGELTHQQYIWAHVMHINDHLAGLTHQV